ncbi:MAG: hypothetical protein OHK0021_19620 [Bryobacter sp.]
MSMVRCPQGHYFEPEKHTSCPYCGVGTALESAPGKTRAIPQAGPVGAPPVMSPLASGSNPAKTRSLHQSESGTEPVVGWLVCIAGPDRGRDWRLRAEKNLIGRGSHMDVAVAGDDTISREKHATVLYDPKKATFWLLPGEASGIVYRNDEIVHSPVALAPDDVIELGKTKLVLVPFLSSHREWA